MALVNREVVLAKVESVYNTDPTPTASVNAILVEDTSWSHDSARLIERPAIRASIGTLKSIYGGTLLQLQFSTEVKGSGVAGTAPEIGAILRACGMGETIVASTSVTYAPVSTGHESLTCYYYQDGTLRKLTGGRGAVTMSFETGGFLKAQFTITGHDAGLSDVAVPTATYDTTVPVPLIGLTTFAVGGYSAIIQAMTVDLGNEIAMPESLAAADGFGEVRISKRNVAGTFNPEHVPVATNDFLNQWKNGTALALATGTIGAVAGNRIAISMPAVTYRELAPGDRTGIRTLDIGFGAAEATTDDEISIAFT